MPKSVLIILAAVVVLIAVVVYLGMRYLRSDDEEEFDDIAVEHGSGRGRGGHLPAQGRSRHEHDDLEAERGLQRPVARSGAGRDPQARRDPEPRRDQRGGRDGYYDDDRTELVPAGGRASRSEPAGRRGATGSDTSPGRPRPPAREAGREGRDSGRDGMSRRDGRGRGPAVKLESWEERNREDTDFRGSDIRGRDIRDSDIRDRRDGRAARPASAVRELAVADLDALDRRGASRQASKPDNRRNGQGPREQRDQQEELPAVKPRQSARSGKGKKDDDGDWPSNEWDELSDVDYWAELAADKPFTADGPADSRPSRSERRPAAQGTPDREPASRPGRSSDLDATRRLDQPLLPPVGRDRADDRPARDRGDDWAARERSDDLTSTGPRRAASGRPDRAETARSVPRRPEPSRPEPARPAPVRSEPARSEPARSEPAAGASRRAVPLDDDPLTSPSFPRIAAEDSRSYRRSRSGTHERPAVRSGAEYAAAPTSYDQPAGGYSQRTAGGYENAPASPGGSGVPDHYLMPAASGSGYPAAGYSAHQSGQYSAGHTSPAGYPTPAEGPAAGGNGAGGYGHGPSVPASYQTPAADAGGYQQSQPGYPAAASEYDGGQASYGNGSYGNGSAGHDQGPAGYGQSPAAFGTAPGSYDAGQPGHANGADPLGYAGYGSQGQPGGYGTPSPGYAGATAPGAYGTHQADPGYLPGGQAGASYPYQAGQYQPNVPGSYQAPAATSAPYHYQPASGQPGSQGEPGGYAGADPYAVDPYGYSGYGNRSY